MLNSDGVRASSALEQGRAVAVTRYPQAAAPSHWWLLLIGALPLLAWDGSGIDLRIARLMGSAAGFPWQHHWLPARLLYVGPRVADALLLTCLAALVCFPGLLHHLLSRREALWWLLTTTVCLVVVVLLKKFSATSCPWSLAEFGGDNGVVYVSHWAFGLSDGGPGGCFPSGHASTAFAFIPGWYVLRRHGVAASSAWLACVLAAGMVVGLSQAVRGAHYIGHSLWTGWICWAISDLSYRVLGHGLVGNDHLFGTLRQQRDAHDDEGGQ